MRPCRGLFHNPVGTHGGNRGECTVNTEGNREVRGREKGREGGREEGREGVRKSERERREENIEGCSER